MNPEAFRFCLDSMTSLYEKEKIDAVAAIEARGFLFAAPYALRMGVPLILLRKKGKLPGKTLSRRFSLEYGEDEIFVHEADVSAGMNILIVDDLLATGGTIKASCDLLRASGANVAHVFGVIGLPFLGFAEKLDGITVHTLLDYHGE